MDVYDKIWHLVKNYSADSMDALIKEINTNVKPDERYMVELELFRQSAKHLDFPDFKYIVDKIDPNNPILSDQMLLFSMCKYNRELSIKYLIDNHKHVIDIEGGLLGACRYNNLSLVTYFYDVGARDVNTGLLHAIQNDNYDICLQLINVYKANNFVPCINFVKGEKSSHAIKCIELLRLHGANSNINLNHCFLNVCKRGKPSVIKYLCLKYIEYLNIDTGFSTACKYMNYDVANYLISYITNCTIYLQILEKLFKAPDSGLGLFSAPEFSIVKLLLVASNDNKLLLNTYLTIRDKIVNGWLKNKDDIWTSQKWALNKYFRQLIAYLKEKKTPVYLIPKIKPRLLNEKLEWN